MALRTVNVRLSFSFIKKRASLSDFCNFRDLKINAYTRCTSNAVEGISHAGTSWLSASKRKLKIFFDVPVNALNCLSVKERNSKAGSPHMLD